VASDDSEHVARHPTVHKPAVMQEAEGRDTHPQHPNHLSFCPLVVHLDPALPDAEELSEADLREGRNDHVLRERVVSGLHSKGPLRGDRDVSELVLSEGRDARVGGHEACQRRQR